MNAGSGSVILFYFIIMQTKLDGQHNYGRILNTYLLNPKLKTCLIRVKTIHRFKNNKRSPGGMSFCYFPQNIALLEWFYFFKYVIN